MWHLYVVLLCLRIHVRQHFSSKVHKERATLLLIRPVHNLTGNLLRRSPLYGCVSPDLGGSTDNLLPYSLLLYLSLLLFLTLESSPFTFPRPSCLPWPAVDLRPSLGQPVGLPKVFCLPGWAEDRGRGTRVTSTGVTILPKWVRDTEGDPRVNGSSVTYKRTGLSIIRLILVVMKYNPNWVFGLIQLKSKRSYIIVLPKNFPFLHMIHERRF